MKEEARSALLAKNLGILRDLDRDLWDMISAVGPGPDYQVFPSRSGAPTLKIGESTMHSSYDPEEESERWVEHHLSQWDGFSTPLVFGMGLGYHVSALARRLDSAFLVVEPDPAVFRLALELIDLSGLIGKASFLIARRERDIGRLPRGPVFLMPHHSTVNLNRDLYVKMEMRVRLSERYTILVAGPIYGGSLPVARYVVSALDRLGYEVEFADCSRFGEALQAVDEFTSDNSHRGKLREILTGFASEAIMARVVECKPDLVFALAQAPLTGGVLSRLRSNGIPTAFWFVEDFRSMGYWREVAPFYDYFFTIQDGEFFEALKDLGVKNHHYLPMAASPDIHRPMKLKEDEVDEFSSDLSFVGAGYYNRRRFFSHLVDLDMKIWGNEWVGIPSLAPFIQRQGARISTHDTVRIFNASKINMNLHSSKQHEGVNPYGDFLNPRTFEIAACGGFQLVDRRSHLSRFFDIGEEIVCFESLDEARNKIGHYLEHAEEREEIAARARKRVVKEHTYEKRMEEAMSFLVERGFEGSPSVPGRSMLKDLIKEAGVDTELGAYLARFKGRRSLTLTDIVDDIGMGKGGLSRSEAIFLMMSEFMQKKA